MSLLRRLMVRNMLLDRQLELLATCGVRPNPGVGLADLLARHRESEYERSPFKLLLCVLGSDSEREPYRPLSDNIWYLNVEYIAAPGDYVRLAHRMAILAADALPIAGVHDVIDLRRGMAALSFILSNREIKWHAKIEEGWIDRRIMTNFVDLLAAQDTDKRFTYYDLPGKKCLIGCATPQELAGLRKWTGLDFEWLG